MWWLSRWCKLGTIAFAFVIQPVWNRRKPIPTNRCDMQAPTVHVQRTAHSFGHSVRPTPRRLRLSVAAGMKLYTNPGSRGKIVEWYVAEHQLSVETVILDMRNREHKSDWYLKINPFGKVPAFEDGPVKLFESGAILLYLANKTEQLDPEQFGNAAKWTLFANSTMSEAFFNERNRPTQMPQVLETLNGILKSQDYLTGSSFTVADIAVGSYLLYLPLFFPDMELTRWPALWAYMKRIVARDGCPAPYKEAMEAAIERLDGSGAGVAGFLKKLGMK